MAKRLDCMMEGCNATIEAETEEDVMEQARTHAAEAHPEVEFDEATVERIRSNIQDV